MVTTYRTFASSSPALIECGRRTVQPMVRPVVTPMVRPTTELVTEEAVPNSGRFNVIEFGTRSPPGRLHGHGVPPDGTSIGQCKRDAIASAKASDVGLIPGVNPHVARHALHLSRSLASLPRSFVESRELSSLVPRCPRDSHGTVTGQSADTDRTANLFPPAGIEADAPLRTSE